MLVGALVIVVGTGTVVGTLVIIAAVGAGVGVGGGVDIDGVVLGFVVCPAKVGVTVGKVEGVEVKIKPVEPLITVVPEHVDDCAHPCCRVYVKHSELLPEFAGKPAYTQPTSFESPTVRQLPKFPGIS